MDIDLDLFAEVADGPLVIEELPDGNSLAVTACIIGCIATHVCVASQVCVATHATATECMGTAATITCGPCVASVIQ
jgi:hypothetical protein